MGKGLALFKKEVILVLNTLFSVKTIFLLFTNGKQPIKNLHQNFNCSPQSTISHEIARNEEIPPQKKTSSLHFPL